MNELLVVADVLGRNVQTGKVVRTIAVIDDGDTARLFYTQEIKSSIEVSEFKLIRIERGGFSRRKNYTFIIDDGAAITVAPQSCSCGAGKIAYADPTPGFKRVPAIMPDGLEVRK